MVKKVIMNIPFSDDQFLRVFQSYNTAIWPAQVVLHAFGSVLAIAALPSLQRWARMAIPPGLALLWGWSGIVYHIGFFADINPVARFFGMTFIVQAIVLLIWGLRAPALRFRPLTRFTSAVGIALLTYALVVYPVLNFRLGHAYPSMPTFGAPCPVVIATFGFLALASPRAPWVAWVIPVLWAAVGTSAALTLGMREDLGLPVAAILAIAVRVRSQRPRG